MHAATKRKDFADFLLQNGSMIQSKSINYGLTAIDFARERNHPETIEVIERHIKIRNDSFEYSHVIDYLYKNPSEWVRMTNDEGEPIITSDILGRVVNGVPNVVLQLILSFAFADKIIPFGENKGERTERLIRDIAMID